MATSQRPLSTLRTDQSPSRRVEKGLVRSLVRVRVRVWVGVRVWVWVGVRVRVSAHHAARQPLAEAGGEARHEGQPQHEATQQRDAQHLGLGVGLGVTWG